MKKLIQILIGVAIGAVGLYFFLKGFDIKMLAHEIKTTPLRTVIIATVLGIASLYFRALRWNIMLPPIPGANKTKLFPITVIGFMINNILPARIGEAARVVLLWRNNKYPIFIGIGTLLIERFFDTAIIALFFIVPVFVMPQLANLTSSAIPVGLVIGAISFVGFLYLFIPKQIKAPFIFLCNKFPIPIRTKLLKTGHELCACAGWSSSFPSFVSVISLSVIIELCYAAIVLVVVRDQAACTWLSAMFVQAAASLGAAIPLAPGYVGTMDAMMFFALEKIGIMGDPARAITIIFHLATYVPVTLLGLFYFFSMDIKFKDISKAKVDISK